MRDLKLSDDHDPVIEGFDLKLTDDGEIVKQRIKQALLLFKGEWFLNVDLGIPYYEEILGEKNAIGSIKAIFVDSIKKVAGVRELSDFNIKFDDKSRTVAINFTVIDDFNNLLEIEI